MRVRLSDQAPHVAVVPIERAQADPRAITVAQVVRVPALRMIAGESAVRTTPDEGAGGGEGRCRNEDATLS